VVVGGGEVAERKVRGLLAEDARVLVVSPQLSPGLAALVREEKCRWREKEYDPADIEGAFLVFAATDNAVVQRRIAEDARRLGILLNVSDSPEQCSFHVPATVQRGDLTLAVSTAGTSPAVAALVRRRLEEQYGEEYTSLLRLMGRLRSRIIAAAPTCSERKILFQNILHGDIVEWIRDGRWDRVQQHLDSVLGAELHLDISQLGPEV